MNERSKKRKRKTFFKRRSAQGIIAAVSVILLCVILYFVLFPPPNNSNVFHFKAAIVDQLGGGHINAQPNQTFIQAAEEILNASGFEVDYIEGANVTVDFYRNLSSQNYGLIILRAHSATSRNETNLIALFSSELFNESRYQKLKDDGVVPVAFAPYEEGDPIYFGVSPTFVRDNMNGSFENTIIIMTGCNGLSSDPQMAKAFIAKGAKAYFGWSGPVMASYTDNAATRLLQHLIVEKKSIKAALAATYQEVGGDPSYDSVLGFYPRSAGDYVIPNATDNSAVQSIVLQQTCQHSRNLGRLTLQFIATTVLGCYPPRVVRAFHSLRHGKLGVHNNRWKGMLIPL